MNDNQNKQNPVSNNLPPPTTPIRSDTPPIPDYLSGSSDTPVSHQAMDINSTPLVVNGSAPLPKKKFGTNKIIATILGIAILFGGIAAGVLIIKNPQLFKQKALTTIYNDCVTNGNTCVPNSSECAPPAVLGGGTCSSGVCCTGLNVSGSCTPGLTHSCTINGIVGTQTCTSSGTWGSCNTTSYTCTANGYTCVPNISAISGSLSGRNKAGQPVYTL